MTDMAETDAPEVPRDTPEAEAVTGPVDTFPTAPELLTIPGGIPDMDVDMRARVALAREANLPLRVRMPLLLYNPKTLVYTPWENVRFMATFPSAEWATRFREDLEAFMRQWFEAAGHQD